MQIFRRIVRKEFKWRGEEALQQARLRQLQVRRDLRAKIAAQDRVAIAVRAAREAWNRRENV